MQSSFADPAVVFRSARRRACDDRAFVLTAVGIASEVRFVGGDIGYEVVVEGVVREQALQQLWMYEEERRNLPVPEPDPPPPQPRAWWGSIVYALVLFAVPLALVWGLLPADPYDVGTVSPDRMRAGEWSRAITALTLHWDAPHLLGNLSGGALLGYSAAQVWGSARAWLLILLAAAVANATEALLGLTHYVSAGASTAVFAALGLVSAHAWRTRGQHAPSAMKRWAPLLAGIALLGMFGAGSAEPGAEITDPTNVLSHALGFIAGALAGVAVAAPRIARLLGRLPTWLAGTLPLAAVAVAWWAAFSFGVVK